MKSYRFRTFSLFLSFVLFISCTRSSKKAEELALQTEKDPVEKAIQLAGESEEHCPDIVRIIVIGDIRKNYICEVEVYLPKVYQSLNSADISEDVIAKTLHNLRRKLGIKYKDKTPEWLLAPIYARNEGKYNDAMGPTFEYLKEVENKTDQEIVRSSMTVGGKDLLFDNADALKLLKKIDDAVKNELLNVKEATSLFEKLNKTCGREKDKTPCVHMFEDKVYSSECLVVKGKCSIN